MGNAWDNIFLQLRNYACSLILSSLVIHCSFIVCMSYSMTPWRYKAIAHDFACRYLSAISCQICVYVTLLEIQCILKKRFWEIHPNTNYWAHIHPSWIFFNFAHFIPKTSLMIDLEISFLIYSTTSRYILKLIMGIFRHS